MNLRITIDYSEVLIELVNNRRILDVERLLYYHDLDEKLITYIDKLLKRNNIDVSTLKRYKIQGNLGKNSTSIKIAEAVVGALRC